MYLAARSHGCLSGWAGNGVLTSPSVVHLRMYAEVHAVATPAPPALDPMLEAVATAPRGRNHCATRIAAAPACVEACRRSSAGQRLPRSWQQFRAEPCLRAEVAKNPEDDGMAPNADPRLGAAPRVGSDTRQAGARQVVPHSVAADIGTDLGPRQTHLEQWGPPKPHPEPSRYARCLGQPVVNV